MNTVKLLYTKNGMVIEGYEWKNIFFSRDGLGIAHDLYHHRPGESGKLWEEFRTVGAKRRFQGEILAKIFSPAYQHHLNQDDLEYNVEYFYPKYVKSSLEIPQDFIPIVYRLENNFKYPLRIMEILMDGYLYALQYSPETLEKVKALVPEIKKAFEEKRDLYLDKNSGELV